MSHNAQEARAAALVREPLERPGARGFRYGPLERDLVERALRWLERGSVAEGEEIRPGRLFRWRGLAVKLFGPAESRRFKDWFLHSPAIRSADLHAAILPVPSPRPLLALDRRAGGRRQASILIYEWVVGDSLDQVFGRDAAALAALPVFVASMHAQRVFHGDFHVQNLLWSGREWLLLDLQGLRHPLRTLIPRRLAVEHWAKIGFGLEHWRGATSADLKPLFERYLEASTLLRAADWDAVLASWMRIRARRP